MILRRYPFRRSGAFVKKIASLLAVVALSAGLLAGCASTTEDEPALQASPNNAAQSELTEMREANDLHAVFNKHVIVNCTTESWGVENGEEVWQGVTRTQFNSVGAGPTYYSEVEQESGIVSSTASYGDDVTPFAMYSIMPEVGFKMLGAYPAADYDALVCQQWLMQDAEVEEVVLSSSVDEATGSKMLTTELVYESSAIRIEIIYFIDAETGLLTGTEETTYDLETGDKLNISRSNIWYDEPIEFTYDPVAEIRQGENLCTITLVLNPGQDNEETQVLTAVEGTSISVVSGDAYGTFADAECTQPLDELTAAGAEMTVYAKPVA